MEWQSTFIRHLQHNYTAHSKDPTKGHITEAKVIIRNSSMWLWECKVKQVNNFLLSTGKAATSICENKWHKRKAKLNNQ